MSNEDQPTGKPDRKVRRFVDVPAPKPKELANMRERIERWKNRETWRLWEACDLALHVPPVKGLRDIRMMRAVDSEDLCERAIRAAIGGALVLISASKIEESTKDAWVRPFEFARWIATQGHFIGMQRVQVFVDLFPSKDESLAISETRAKVLSSGYSTPAFDAAIAAIAEFWLDAKQRSDYPGKKQVVAWLMEVHGLKESAADEVDRIIRRKEASQGGRKPPKQKPQ